MSRSGLQVAVLGAGVCGLASAVKLQELLPDAQVVVLAEQFSPHTTGDGSAGLWLPYLCGATPEDLLTRWGLETYRFVHALWLEGGHGVSALPTLCLRAEPGAPPTPPAWSTRVFGFHPLDAHQLHRLSELHSAEYSSGFCFTSFTADVGVLLGGLRARLERAGGRVLRARLTSLREPRLRRFHALVNCTGLGAGALLPDAALVPIRGQVERVELPWMYQVITDLTSGHYIIPNTTSCVLGGTSQAHDTRTTVDAQDTAFIRQGCTRKLPGIQHAKKLNQWAGLRPGRQSVRLELETQPGGQLVVHNYGHGGSGVTLFWGCAAHAAELVRRALASPPVHPAPPTPPAPKL